MMIIDPWVKSYERLHDILYCIGIPENLSPKKKKDLLLNRRGILKIEEFQEALRLFKFIYSEEKT